MTGNTKSFTKLLENFSGEPATLLLYWVIPKDGSVGAAAAAGIPRAAFFLECTRLLSSFRPTASLTLV
jgi:hypothetical protein